MTWIIPKMFILTFTTQLFNVSILTTIRTDSTDMITRFVIYTMSATFISATNSKISRYALCVRYENPHIQINERNCCMFYSRNVSYFLVCCYEKARKTVSVKQFVTNCNVGDFLSTISDTCKWKKGKGNLEICSDL